MQQRELHITISPSGDVEIHMEGYKGKGCMNVAKAFESAVGKIVDATPTSEFYLPEENAHIQVDQNQR